jgi:hypothetical protein
MPPTTMSAPEIQPELHPTSFHIGEAIVNGTIEAPPQPVSLTRMQRLRARLGGIIADLSDGCGKSPLDDSIYEKTDSTATKPDAESKLPLVVGYAKAEQTKYDLVWNVSKPDATRAMLREARAARLRRQDTV